MDPQVTLADARYWIDVAEALAVRSAVEVA